MSHTFNNKGSAMALVGDEGRGEGGGGRGERLLGGDGPYFFQS